MRSWLLLSVVALMMAGTIGCQAPCDRMCDARADYLEACIDFTQYTLDEDLSPPAGWDIYDDANLWWTDTYGVSGVDDYAAACKESADGILADKSGDDRTLQQQECDDEALVYESAIEEEGDPSCHLFP